MINFEKQFDNIESKSDSKFISSHTVLVEEKPIMSDFLYTVSGGFARRAMFC